MYGWPSVTSSARRPPLWVSPNHSGDGCPSAELLGVFAHRCSATRTTLTKARLSGATLTKADLSEADLVSAFWSEETQWPSEYGAGVRERSVSPSDGGWRIQEVGNSGADPSEPPLAPTG
ncbi:pentapeptide repeat-containing protein [Streptomyces tauricus]|uniref:pentapeptide repeat-containing protein n=1 Tax=Streptomyces tauricus TaxID=68274 RepID=UPI0038B6AAEB